MTGEDAPQTTETVLPCADLTATLDYYTERLGFRLDSIFPADAPRVALISGHGIRLRLERQTDLAAGDAPPELSTPAQSLVVQRGGAWGMGRAGMQYRDLIPGRLDGRYVASHIRITKGGPVADYVHHHHVRFQMIYCRRGWARVVYEDQGPPFKMQAGDCVLQPPHIRHRVLESSDGMEVIEFSAPAEHQTLVDHEMTLPTSSLRPEHDFGGQRFVFHQAAEAKWRPSAIGGFDARDTGIGAATQGQASAQVLRPAGASRSALVSHDAECYFNFVLQGSTTLDCQGNPPWALTPGDTCVIPAGPSFAFARSSNDLELLQIALPGRFATTRHPDGFAK